ncbi:MAG: LptF/LptG family permease [Leptospiraceae bacterium]|nr:LptF/LptG family permease [Leptospiraceae bacterium]MDW7976364.1 LptF/LptG family permease [Leptospiraceae bacterium]
MNLPRLKTIDIYILKEILTTFFVMLLFWTLFFIVLIFKDLIGELIGKGIDTLKILEYLVYLIGEKITFTIPIASLLAGILATGRLSSDSEITAMRASGISFKRIHAIYLLFGVVVMFFVGVFYFYLGPLSSKARYDFEEWLKTYYSLSLVKSGRFMNVSDTESMGDYGQDIYVQYRDGSHLKNVHIRRWKNSFEGAEQLGSSIKSRIVQIIFAEKGTIMSRIKENGEVENFIRLEKGYMIESHPNWTKLEITDFRNGFMDYILPKLYKKVIKLDVKPENYTFWELWEFLYKLDQGEHRIDLFHSDGVGAVKLDDIFTGQKLPSIGEMKGYLNQQKIWLVQNYGSVGKENGPSLQEFNQVAQLVFRLEIFIKDVEKTKRKFEFEIQRRLSIPVSVLLFFYLSFPLGLVVKRAGRGMSFSLALIVFFLYYSLVSLGTSNAFDGRWNPIMSAWLPNVVLFLVGNYLLSVKTDEIRPLGFFVTLMETFYRKYLYNHPWFIYGEKIFYKAIEFIKKIVAKIKNTNKTM